MSDKTVMDVMTELDKVFMLPKDAHLDRELMDTLTIKGHSRVPVYKNDRQDAVEYLMVSAHVLSAGAKHLTLVHDRQVKTLIHHNPADCIPISALQLSPLLKVFSDESPFDVLNKFQHFAAHIAGVYERGGNLFNALDTTKDGKIDSADLTLIDENSDGTIDRPELSAALKSMGGTDRLIGIVTLEDILEEILQEKIVDETDDSKVETQAAGEERQRFQRKMSVIKRANVLALRASQASGSELRR